MPMTIEKPRKAKKKSLRILYQALEQFRILHPEMPTQMVMTFLFIAQHEGCSVREIEGALGISQSSASRNAAALGNLTAFKKPGYGLVEAKADPMELRRKILRLTPKGKMLMTTLETIMEK